MSNDPNSTGHEHEPTPEASGLGRDPARAGEAPRSPAQMREAIAAVVEPVVSGHRCEIVEIEYRREPVGWVLRLFVERIGHDPRTRVGGVGLDECVRISRDVSTALDVADLIQHHYNLEVSSPGLDRPLTKPADWARFVGLRAKLRLESAVDAHPGRKAYRGEILALDEGATVRLRDDEVGEVAIPLERIGRAHLVYEVESRPKPGKKGARPKGPPGNKTNPRKDGENRAPRKVQGASENDR